MHLTEKMTKTLVIEETSVRGSSPAQFPMKGKERNGRGVLRGAVCGLAFTALSTGSAFSGETSGGFTGDAATYVGALAVSDGLKDRTFAGFFGNVYTEGGVGFHLDLSHQWREEDAGFGAIGISAELSPGIRPKLQIGGSTDNEGILPEFLVDASVRVELGDMTGLVFDLGGAYREFRNGVDEGSLRGEVIKYFDAFADGSYLVGQAYLGGIFADPGSNFGWEARAGVTYVMPSAWSIGLTVAGGEMAYDEVVASIGVENTFITLRPHVSFNITDQLELFVQGEFLTSDLYDIGGGFAGIKVNFQ